MSMTVTPAKNPIPAEASAPPPSFGWGLFKALRPKQWVKSVLVPAAPAAAGVLSHGTVLWHTIVAVITFSLCASGGYLINDAAETVPACVLVAAITDVGGIAGLLDIRQLRVVFGAIADHDDAHAEV